MANISDTEFAQFQRFIFEAAGITLPDTKKAMVTSRLARRLEACRLPTYSDYLKVLKSGQAGDELQTAVDLLTTNETYFFREPKHFEFLRKQVTTGRNPGAMFRVWSAAGSTGEEAYSIAMVLEDCIPGQWEVIASDISSRVLERARSGHYPIDRIDNFPAGYLQRFCLKGHGDHEGSLLIDKSLRDKVKFQRINLNAALPQLGQFDIVFLRNVLIYFNADTKRSVIKRIATNIKPNGHLLIGHSESISDLTDVVVPIAPAIYRKPR